jgi:CheY-like chemotaxis protein
MIVDDEEDSRKIVTTALRDKYEVTEAFDGLDALEKIERHEPDLIVLDIKMPMMDGLETCEAIRKNPSFRDTPVMFLSVLDKRDDIVKTYKAGGSLFLSKPVDPERLLKNVDLFFTKHTKLPRQKSYTVEQIREMDKEGAERTADSAREPEAQLDAQIPPIPTEEEPVEKLREYRGLVKPRVMIVDDDPNVITMMMIALRDDFEVVKAMDGLEAIEKIIKYQPDILIVDIMMPKMSGYQLCQSLRRNKTFQNVPIIVASAKSSRRDQDYALRSGANSFIAKPYEPGRLVKLVESFVQCEGFVIRKKSVSYQEINEAEKEEREKQRRREEEHAKKMQRSQLQKHIEEKMQQPQPEKEEKDRG